MKNPSALCNQAIQDQNQKHFVQECHSRFPNANNGVNAVFNPADNVTFLDPVTKQFKITAPVINGEFQEPPPSCEGCIIQPPIN